MLDGHELHLLRVATSFSKSAKPRRPIFGTSCATLQGETLDGHDLDLLRVGTDGEGKRRIWVVARQHPGESMAGVLSFVSWFPAV